MSEQGGEEGYRGGRQIEGLLWAECGCVEGRLVLGSAWSLSSMFGTLFFGLSAV